MNKSEKERQEHNSLMKMQKISIMFFILSIVIISVGWFGSTHRISSWKEQVSTIESNTEKWQNEINVLVNENEQLTLEVAEKSNIEAKRNDDYLVSFGDLNFVKTIKSSMDRCIDEQNPSDYACQEAEESLDRLIKYLEDFHNNEDPPTKDKIGP